MQPDTLAGLKVQPMQTMKPWILALLLSVIVSSGCSGVDKPSPSDSLVAGGSTSSGQTQAITGAGSSFVNPAMAKWAYSFAQTNPNVTINYQSIGSGAGIGQFKKGTVDFGATDVAMPDDDLATLSSPAIQIPMISGCTVVAYNLPGIANGVKLSGDVIADIFLGTITK